MDDVVAELEACSPSSTRRTAARATMIMQRPEPREARRAAEARRQRRVGRSRCWRSRSALLLARGRRRRRSTSRRAVTNGGAGAASGDAVTLSGVGAYDPDGGDGGARRRWRASRRTAIAATFWRTSTYRSQLSASSRASDSCSRRPGRRSRSPSRPTRPASRPRSGRATRREGPFETVGGGQRWSAATTTWDLDETRRAVLRHLDHQLDRQRARQRGEGELATRHNGRGAAERGVRGLWVPSLRTRAAGAAPERTRRRER